MLDDKSPPPRAEDIYDAPPSNILVAPKSGFESAELVVEGDAHASEEDAEGASRMPEADGLESAAAVSWPSTDRDSPCYRHMLSGDETTVSTEKFLSFDRDAFELYLAANRYKPVFTPVGSDEVIAFALRGAKLMAKVGFYENVESIALELTRPDHSALRCVIGYYFRKTGTFSAYTGSTVPQWQYITGERPKSGPGDFNMMQTGCYIFIKGTHAASSNSPIRPALRISSDSLKPGGTATVMRRKQRSGTIFDFGCYWANSVTGDNVHCAFTDDTGLSAGCQTVKGKNGTDGQWSKFQALLAKLPDGCRVEYVLLTGSEAAIAAACVRDGKTVADADAHQRLGRLRMGSQGEEVQRLTKVLGIQSSTYFGPGASKRLTELQTQNGVPADAIFSPAIEAQFGGGIFSGVHVAKVTQPPAQPEATEAPKGGTDNAFVPKNNTNTGDTGSSGVQKPSAPPITPTGTRGNGATTVTRTKLTALLTREHLSTIAPRPRPEKATTPAKKAAREEEAKIWDRYMSGLVTDEAAAVFAHYKLDENPQRFAIFLANIMHETGGLTVVHESGAYGKDTLLKYFGVGKSKAKVTEAEAAAICALPVANDQRAKALFERIYGIEKSKEKAAELGNKNPGDGYRFRGGGMFQTTGRFNYTTVGNAIGVDLANQPELIEDPVVSLKAAAHEWDKGKLNGRADEGSFRVCCNCINYGNAQKEKDKDPIGYDQRKEFLQTIVNQLGLPPIQRKSGALESTGPDSETFECGDTNPAIMILQQRLNALGYDAGATDGKFSYQMRDALLSFQASNGLDVTGITDRASREALAKTDAVVHWRRGNRLPQGGSADPAVVGLQKRLGDLGYHDGPADGRFGERLRDALLSFQVRNGVPATGIYDAATHAVLDSDEPMQHWRYERHPGDVDDEHEGGAHTSFESAPVARAATVASAAPALVATPAVIPAAPVGMRQIAPEPLAPAPSQSAVRPSIVDPRIPDPPGRGTVLATMAIAILGLAAAFVVLAIIAGWLPATGPTRGAAGDATIPLMLMGWILALIACLQALRGRLRRR
jgi:putative chitinase